MQRFWSKVDKTETCWLWTAGTVGGYGTFKFEGKMIYAHRFSYELLVGPIPEGLIIDHLCRIHNCVRPEHLQPVTNVVNIRRGNKGILKTHCKHGHLFDEVNTLETLSGRACRACHRDFSRRRYHESKR